MASEGADPTCTILTFPIVPLSKPLRYIISATPRSRGSPVDATLALALPISPHSFPLSPSPPRESLCLGNLLFLHNPVYTQLLSQFMLTFHVFLQPDHFLKYSSIPFHTHTHIHIYIVGQGRRSIIYY